MILFLFYIFFFFFLFFSNFHKKLLCLLSIEISMIILICSFFFFCFNSLGIGSFFSFFLLLCFMVLDSVFGISLLVGSCRVTSPSFLNISNF